MKWSFIIRSLNLLPVMRCAVQAESQANQTDTVSVAVSHTYEPCSVGFIVICVLHIFVFIELFLPSISAGHHLVAILLTMAQGGKYPGHLVLTPCTSWYARICFRQVAWLFCSLSSPFFYSIVGSLTF